MIAALRAVSEDWPAGSQVYVLANDKDQARDDLVRLEKIVRANPLLGERLTIRKNVIERKDGGGFVEVLPAQDVTGQHGKTFQLVVFDEIHGYRTWDLFEALAFDPSIRDAVRRTGCRVVVQAGMSQLGPGERMESMLCVDYVPHDWLLPRAGGIVHHGGAGTCAAAIRAGIPQAVIWHIGDQPAWGKLLYKRGVAVAPLRQTRLSPVTLANCFERLAFDVGIRKRAARLGAQVRTENGVQRAVELITACAFVRPRSRGLDARR
jgi:hypothetical protein